jgi:pilus assembly protein CpaE
MLEKAGYETHTASSGVEALEAARAYRPDLIILDLILPDIDGVQVFEQLRQDPELASIHVIVLSSIDDPEEIAEILTNGIDDYIVKKKGADKELLGKCAAFFSSQAEPTVNLGQMISFFSAKGGNGTSTLCLNLAHAMVELVAPKKMVVVDLVLPLGSLGLMLGADQDYTISDLTGQDDESIKDLLGRSRIPHKDIWDFHILPGSATVREAQEVHPARIEPLFDLLREKFDYTIVDLGRTLSRISLPVIQHSKALVVVVGPDLVTVELTRAALDYLEEMGIDEDRIFLVLNRAVGREGMTKTEIEEAMGMPIWRSVPYSTNNFTLTINQKIPYVARFPGDGTALCLKDIATLLKKQLDDE